MAGYREHIGVSSALGVGYATVTVLTWQFSLVQGALAACLASFAGMLPDLDAEGGKPVRELFGVLGAVVPLVVLQRLRSWGADPERSLLLAVNVYALVRFGAPTVLGHFTVHRGMFHSVPALLIAMEVVFLGYHSSDIWVRCMMAGAVGIGFLSHLVLDELYSVEWDGSKVRLKKSAGTALKLTSTSFPAVSITYGILFGCTYACLFLLDDLVGLKSLLPAP